jgi:hypothetical protein
VKQNAVLPNKKGIIYDHRFILAVIVAIAIILRSFPAWLNPAWGVDYGIYTE